MANATKITVNSLTSGTALEQPTADVLDTGTTAVTLPITPDGDSHNILLEFTNNAAAADTGTITILAGDLPPALESGLGDLSFTLAQNAVKYLVVDSGRFMQSDGTILISFTPASTKTQTFTVRAYKLPK